MRTLIKTLLAMFFMGLLSAAQAQGDTKKCDKLTGAEKEKCLADAKK